MRETRLFYRFHGESWFHSDLNRFIVLILLEGTLITSQSHGNPTDGPCYISAWLCRMTLQMFGINTVPLHTHETEGFLPSASLAEPLITNRTKAIVLVTPNNPVSATRLLFVLVRSSYFDISRRGQYTLLRFSAILHLCAANTASH
jgi:hypothetical protein